MNIPSEKINELSNNLKKELGDPSVVRMDLTTRILYSTDASIYQIQPLGVVLPRTSDEMTAVVALCSQLSIPVLARGAGSSLAGQAIGEAVIIDCSRYLNQILDIDPVEKVANVQPGVILDDLNKQANLYGLQFGPDPASSERATVGGCVANNATGAHSISYGMTVDHVLDVNVVLSDGSEAKFGRIPLDKARSISQGVNVEADLYRKALSIREEAKTAIMEKWPKTWRNASGYNLNYLLPWASSNPPGWQYGEYPPVHHDEINLAHLIAGSEGTLGIIKSVRLNLVSSPQHKILVILSYHSIEEACDEIPGLLMHQPTAIELIPRTILNAAKSVPAYAPKASFITGDPEAILVIEFSGQDYQEVMHKAFYIGRDPIIAETDEQQKNIWAVRKVGLGILQSKPGDIKPIAFIEDVAVPVERLGQFVREMNKIMVEYGGTTCEVYAHASAGCLHIRPLLNLKNIEGIIRLRSIAEQTVNLAHQLGGTISGEHGDGIARAEWIERQYGPIITEAFRDLKRAADPRELLNPGKKVCLSQENKPPPMDMNLRYGTQYSVQVWQPVMSFKDEEGLAGAIEQCNGAGVCRKSSGVMCPSFQASKEEMHSTRGRSNLLRAMISGQFPTQDYAERVVYEALDLCLACKGCKSECPSSVDVAKLKYEFLARYYENHSRRIRDYLFGYIGSISTMGFPLRKLVNGLFRAPWVKTLSEKMFGITSERTLPQYAPRSLRQTIGDGYYHRTSDYYENSNQVLLLVDAFTEYFFPEIGIAAIRVIEETGYSVSVLPSLGAGRTLISKGFLEPAIKHARHVLNQIKDTDPENKAMVIGIEPSEIYTLRDEYLDFFKGDDFAQNVAIRAWMVDEFLIRPGIEGYPRVLRIDNSHSSTGISNNLRVGLHGHCYQKARPPVEDGYPVGVEATTTLLKILGCDVEVIDSGCCGMAGAFGYEEEHYDFSIRVSDEKLIPAIIKMPQDTIIITTGFSCHSQIHDRTQRKVLHPVQLIQLKTS